MKYAINLLKAKLKEEKAILKDHTPEIRRAKYNADRAAFTESVRLAMERVPQLEKAIECLQQKAFRDAMSCIEYGPI